MPVYTYRAINKDGKTVSGKQTAANELDLEGKLRDIDLDLIKARALREAGTGGISFGGVRAKDKIMLCVQLQQLDKAGVPILDALGDLRDTIDTPALKHLVTDVYESVRSGSMLSEALAKHPKTFDSVFVGLVGAGERTGNLADSFENLAHHLKWNNEMKRKIKKATTGPIFTLLLLVGVVIFMMTNVVPQLKSFLEAQGQDLPGYTVALLDTSAFFENYWYIVMFVPLSLFVLLKVLKKSSKEFLYAWDSFKLKWPILGNAMRKIDLARFTRFFGVLYTSGIDILDCIKISQQVVRNTVLVDSMETVRKSVSEGSSITAALRRSGQFPSLVVRMFKVGEDSGNMKEALENINFFYDREVNDTVDLLISSIKPIMTIVLGIVLVWIAAAMFGPIYGTIEKMQSQI